MIVSMDTHVIVTLILSIINAIVLPWAVFVTLKLFTHETLLALQGQNNKKTEETIIKLDTEVNKDFVNLKIELKGHMDRRFDDIIKLIKIHNHD